MDYRLEVVAVPERRRRGQAFYERIGYHIDHDHRVSDELRFVQITPLGSCWSIVIGNGITPAPPGSAQRLQVVVDDVEAARAQLRDAGVEVGDVEDSPAGRFVFFSDPDGNGWTVLQFLGRDQQRAPRTADGRRHPRATGDPIRLGLPLAIAGGFRDAFTYTAQGAVSANAQTGNPVRHGVFAAGGDWLGAARHVLPILAFFVGAASPKQSRTRRASAGAAAAALRPGARDRNACCRWSAAGIVQRRGRHPRSGLRRGAPDTIFGRLSDSSINTTLTPVNLRTAASSADRALIRRQRGPSRKAVAFGAVCPAFLLVTL